MLFNLSLNLKFLNIRVCVEVEVKELRKSATLYMPIGQKSTMQKLISFLFEYGRTNA